MAITILDLARVRGVQESADGGISGDAFYDVGLAIMGGCGVCGASIAAYNAYPSKSGYWKCGDCIGEDGWDDAKEANVEIMVKRLQEEREGGQER